MRDWFKPRPKLARSSSPEAIRALAETSDHLLCWIDEPDGRHRIWCKICREQGKEWIWEPTCQHILEAERGPKTSWEVAMNTLRALQSEEASGG